MKIINGIKMGVDPRIEMIHGVVAAYSKDLPSQATYEWIEYPNTAYFNELCKELNIDEYPELFEYLNRIVDCGRYNELASFFDENMNYIAHRNNNEDSYYFSSGTVLEFASLIKTIYEHQNMRDFFKKYILEFEQMETFIMDIPSEFNTTFLDNYYRNSTSISYNAVVSSLINGGFSISNQSEVTCVKGLCFDNNEYHSNKYNYLVTLVHEFSHPSVNKMIDKHFDEFINLDSILEEAKANGLPKSYQKITTLLYEYFVRANSIFLTKDYLPEDEIKEQIEWFKSIGFIHVEELIDIIKNNYDKYLNFEDILVNECIPYFNSLFLSYT